MLGFMPGFTYLGGMSEKIATPRLESPRLQIYPGSVGIAGKQTGMYLNVSWWLENYWKNSFKII